MEVMSQIVSIHEERNPLPTGAGDAPMIKGVKVLGVESKNGRKYPVEVMRKALEKYDGAMVNIDHPKGDEPRSYEDRFGRLVNPRLEADGIYADLSYNPKHPLAEGFAWWAANDPSAVGLSHNAQARTKLNREGVEEIEEIVEVTSVDLVAEPATTAGLMECVMRVKRVSERCWDGYEPTPGKEPYSKGSCKKEGDEDMREEDKVIPKPKVRTEADKMANDLYPFVFSLQSNLKSLKSHAQSFKNFYNKILPIFDKSGPKTKANLNKFYMKIVDNIPTTGSVERAEVGIKDFLDYLKNLDDISEADYKSMNDRFDARVKQLAKDGYKQVKPNIFAKNDVGFTNKQIMRMSDDEWNNFRGFGQPVSQLIAKKESDDMEPELFPAEKENDEGNGYEDSLKDQIGDIVMNDELHAEEKVAKLLALLSAGQEEPEESPIAEAEYGDDEEPKEEQDEDEKDPEKTEESLRRKPNPAVARLLEEVDAYRARDRREKAVTEARKFCSEASLPPYAITESFLGILADVNKKQWKTLVEDRRRVIFRGEKPISSVPADGKLTVDSLVKALRS